MGGRVGRAVAKLGRLIPQQQVSNDLRRLKQVLEIGEVVQSDAEHSSRPASRTAVGPQPMTAASEERR